MDTHKVLVMDAGQVAEFGPVPTLLAKEEGGLFRSMALSE
jgi:ABC-type multidrug transport system fused ATPase/permease subunit